MEINKPDNLESIVMSEIKSGRIKLRSRYIFLAEKLGLGSAFILSALLGVLFVNLALFYLKESGNLAYLSFGQRGVFAFLESFPYLLVVAVIFLLFLAGYIFKKSGFFYKNPFGVSAILIISLIVIVGAFLSFTGIGEGIEKRSFGHDPAANMLFRPIFERGLDERERSAAGRVSEIGEGYITVQTPRNTQKILTQKLQPDKIASIAVGDLVMAVGQKTDEGFVADDLRETNPEEMRMIKRGIDRRFGEDARPPLPEVNSCLKKCAGDTTATDSCRMQCLPPAPPTSTN